MATKSETRRAVVRIAWRARGRARRLPEGVERNRAWMEMYQAIGRAKGLARWL